MMGALPLLLARLIALPVIFGAIAGCVLAGAAFNALSLDNHVAALPFYWHLILGTFPFCIAFIATDWTVAPVTRPGKWVYGLLIGLLTVMLRVMHPDHPESSLQACLLAALFAPLIDHGCLRFQLSRAQRAKGS